MYSLVIGVLAAIGLAILVLAMKMSDITQGVYTRDGAEYQAAVPSRHSSGWAGIQVRGRA